MTVLAIATLFPLDTVAAGDEANATALVRRARQRGIAAELTTVTHPDGMVPARIYLLGGDGLAGVSDLVAHLHQTPIIEHVRSGMSQVVAVDAGMVALCRAWTDADGGTHDGLGLLAATAAAQPPRLQTVISIPNPALGLPAVVGWSSRGYTLVPDVGLTPLVQLAVENDDQEPVADGALTDNVIATSLHGPVLALNPELADLVLARALGVPGFEPLAIPTIERARAQRIAEAAQPAGRRKRTWPTRRAH
jgi:hypothetical protein